MLKCNLKQKENGFQRVFLPRSRVQINRIKTSQTKTFSPHLVFWEVYGLPKSVIDKLQYVQNSAARLVTRTRSSEHITPVLRRLHWLPVRQRITYKLLLLTYKALNGMAPRYIADLLQPYTPTRQLRFFSKNLLVTPKSNLKFYGDRSFQVAVPRLFNCLPDDIRLIQNLDVFNNKNKSLLFNDAFIS